MKVLELPLNKYCPIAHSLEVLGLKWNLLILREASFGRTRYAEFLKIGVPTDVLIMRLASLVEAGLLERRPYREPGKRTRDEYILTDAGRDALPILAAFTSWGDVHAPTSREPAVLFVDEATGQPVTLAFTDADGTAVNPERVRIIYGPGAVRPED
ncbi:winged helix-turn-helix transcriptional regulator [Streptomyces sp. NPDC055025]